MIMLGFFLGVVSVFLSTYIAHRIVFGSPEDSPIGDLKLGDVSVIFENKGDK